MKHKFLVHNHGDDVGVAVVDIEIDEKVVGVILMDDSQTDVVVSLDRIPLGHKIALKKLSIGDQIIEYGLPVGIAYNAIEVGGYVHTHNMKSARWSN